MAKGQIRQKRDNIKKEQFENLCAIHCTKEEIAGVLGVSYPTLLQWCKDTYGEDFLSVYKQKSMLGKASLRRMQWKLAEKSVPMAIFLGKNMLGQSDNPVQEEINNGILTDLVGALNSAKEHK